jgi:hypothetical protein
MDWQGILGSAGRQNALFWAGAAAVALGATLLVATLAARLRQRRRSAGTRISARQVAAAYGAGQQTTVPASSPVPAADAAVMATVARALAETSAPPAPSLAILLRRLQLAGDRLEEVAREAALDEDAFDDPALKEAPLEVEYVFRASGP